MIPLVHYQSRFSTVAIVFVTCILIPLLSLKRAILRIFNFIFLKYQQEENSQVTAYLSVSRFEDLDKNRSNSNSNSNSNSKAEEMCSICLMEFENEDVVSRLSCCGHVLHMGCFERWLDCNQFTCPLCRSFLLVNVKSSHAKCDNSISHTQLQQF